MWERIQYFFVAAGDIQAKPTRVSGGLDLLVVNVLPKSSRIYENIFAIRRPDLEN